MSWNMADIFDALGEALPGNRPALIHDDRITNWKDFTTRSNNLARYFQELGLGVDDKVSFYMRNCPAYIETFSAAVKARAVHVNVNYRYVEEELHYIIDNSDSKVVVFGSEFADRIAAVRDNLPEVKAWIQVDHQGEELAPDCISYEKTVTTGNGEPLGIKRDGKDMMFIYTGGTTGMPKGVMWKQEDMWTGVGNGLGLTIRADAPKTIEEHVANVVASEHQDIQCPACPLMHGTGLLTALGTMLRGGCVVTLTSSSLDTDELWQTVAKHKVLNLTIVGDAFAKPLLKSLDDNPGKYDISNLRMMGSSGVMWSEEVKAALLEHHPGLMLWDSFGSSEAIGLGSSLRRKGDKGKGETAKFRIGDNCKVFTEDFREIQPGSDEAGYMGRSGVVPLGYYKDPEKSARTFPVINGVQYSIPGDWCKVEADGTITLLGRGSGCINSAGEKIYAEEVEEVIKAHDTIADAIVVGVPDEKWGQAVTAVIQMKPGIDFNKEEVKKHIKEHLASYKSPKHFLIRDDLKRAPNGKADFKGTVQYAREQLGIPA